MIKGITVTLITMKETGKRDAFNHPVYAEEKTDIDDVLVAPASTDDLPANIDLTSGKTVYTMAIPKGDTHKWKNSEVEFFGARWKVIGDALEGIEDNIPLKWNRKITVERYD